MDLLIPPYSSRKQYDDLSFNFLY
ncbi:TPA: hypothetical protein ACPFIO_002568 [Staphylococcus aureus]|nr:MULTISPECIES: hypothetical protein [Staphylococcus]MBZ6435546.1 hypothetical protein [Staphylococcus aureus]MCC5263233.1 hypothetical protein [Staphylococcus aureus]MCC5268743.1 hypothetical protein [Staphylococcus aureus]MCC5273582.1 hypothetical protein [Staphylococcus aureus]MCC5278555.1 hypothetical protein [Staphylococcus aureus]